MAARSKPAGKTRFAKPGKADGTTTSFSLTPDTIAILGRLQREVGDQIGRVISSSTLLRALLRHAEKQDDIVSALDALISTELNAGIHWGRASAKRKGKVINSRST